MSNYELPEVTHEKEQETTQANVRCGSTCQHAIPYSGKCGSQCDQWQGHGGPHECPTHGPFA